MAHQCYFERPLAAYVMRTTFSKRMKHPTLIAHQPPHGDARTRVPAARKRMLATRPVLFPERGSSDGPDGPCDASIHINASDRGNAPPEAAGVEMLIDSCAWNLGASGLPCSCTAARETESGPEPKFWPQLLQRYVPQGTGPNSGK